jgi:hypothetical protein
MRRLSYYLYELLVLGALGSGVAVLIKAVTE